jgi:hypothetical protein
VFKSGQALGGHISRTHQGSAKAVESFESDLAAGKKGSSEGEANESSSENNSGSESDSE